MSDTQNKDLALISKIIHTKDFATPKKMGVNAKMIEGAGRVVWEFIEDYVAKYNSLPTVSAVNNLLAGAGVQLWELEDPIEFLCDQIIERNNKEHIKNFSVDLMRRMTEERAADTISWMNVEATKLLSRKTNELKVVTVDEVMDQVMQTYANAQNGVMGLPTLCPAMDEQTLGWTEGDLSFFVARSGIGKSWALILAADKVLRRGKRVAIFNGEMSNVAMVYRHFALDNKLPYGPLRKGKLDSASFEVFSSALRTYQTQKTLHLIDACGGATTDQIEAVIDNLKPDLVCVDATYRIKSSIKSKDRFENTANVVTELKSIAGRQKVPILGSTQLNRDSTKKKGGDFGTEDLAMTDVLAWESTNIFALYQGDEEKARKQMLFKPVKVREAEKMSVPLRLHWDFERMHFEAVGQFDDMIPQEKTIHAF